MPTARLGSVPLLANQNVTFSVRFGVDPSQFFLSFHEVYRDRIDQIINREVELVIGDVTFKRVVPLAVYPAVHPQILTVAIVDHRYRWHYPHYTGRFNMLRDLGFRRIQADQVRELERTVGYPQYAPWSLIAGTRPWKNVDILGEVLRWGAAEIGFRYRYNPRDFHETEPPSVELDSHYDTALANALQLVPGAGLYVTTDGTVVVTNRDKTSGSARPLPEGRFVADAGYAIVADFRAVAPKEIHFLFQCQPELRFDHIDPGDAGYGTTPIDDGTRRLYNVLPNPDYQLGSVTPFVRGELMDFFDFLSFIAPGASPQIVDPVPPLPANWPQMTVTRKLIRQAAVPYTDLWGLILAAGHVFNPDIDWSARIAAIQQHFRRTFRVDKQWRDAMLEWIPNRIAIVNVQAGTGDLAPAQVFSRYTVINSIRSMIRDQDHAYYGSLLGGYATIMDETVKPAPAIVNIKHPHMGVFEVDWVIDPYRLREMVIPGHVEITGSISTTAGLPSWAPPDVAKLMGSVLSFDGVANYNGEPPAVEDKFEMALIVTAIPATPNSTEQYARIIVKPQDVYIEGVAPMKFEGPIMEIRVPRSMEVARIRWYDEDAARIEAYFKPQSLPRPSRNLDPFPLADLCVNLNNSAVIQGTSKQAAVSDGVSMRSIAENWALREWARYAPRTIGSELTVPGYTDTDLHGWMREKLVDLTPDGLNSIRIQHGVETAPLLDFVKFMQSKDRALLWRLPDSRLK